MISGLDNFWSPRWRSKWNSEESKGFLLAYETPDFQAPESRVPPKTIF